MMVSVAESLDATTSTPVGSEEEEEEEATIFPKCGVKLSFVLGEFVEESCGGRSVLENSNWTTEQVCERFIKPATIDGRISYCELLRQQNHPAYGEVADVFVSHAHQCEFWNVISALRYNLLNRGEDDVIIWFDIFSINQHLTTHWTFDWLCTTFQSSIQEFGHTIMVMSPWNDPIPFRRAWCILEAYWTCVTPTNKFEIAMGERDRNQFLRDVGRDVDASIQSMLSCIRAERSRCSLDSDRQRIFEVIESSTIGGFGRINSLVFEQYRSWVIAVAKQALEQCCEETNPEQKLHHMFVLGRLYSGQGNRQEAQTLLENCYNQRLSLLGNRHEATLSSMHHLSLVCFRTNQCNKALKLCEDCLQHRQVSLGVEHPDTLRSMSTMADLYKIPDGGYKKRAGPMHEECLAIRQRVLGEDHPNTISSMKSVAMYYTDTKWYDKAIQISEEAVQKSERTLGSEHWITFDCRHHLAILYDLLERFDDASPLYQACLANRVSTLGLYHPKTISLQGTIIIHYRKQGKHDDALDLIDPAKIQAVRGKNDGMTLKAMFWVADTHYRMKQYSVAQKQFEAYLERRPKSNKHLKKQAEKRLAQIRRILHSNQVSGA